MIGIFGGTFDPVHFGHLRSALEVKELFVLDHVRLIPCAQPPHREQPLTSPDKRLTMLNQAVEGYPELVVDRRELDRDGYSYMVDTLASLRSEFPHQSLLLFMGIDAYEHIETWHQWQKLFDYSHVIVVTRPTYQAGLPSDFLAQRLTQNQNDLKIKKNGCLYFQSVTSLDISASQIRQIIKQNKNPGFLLPEKVIEYIKQNRLYLH